MLLVEAMPAHADACTLARCGFRQAPLAFLLSFAPGVVCGALYQAQGYKSANGEPTNPQLKEALNELSVCMHARHIRTYTRA